MKRNIAVVSVVFTLVFLGSLTNCRLFAGTDSGSGTVNLVIPSGEKTIQPSDSAIAITGYTVSGTGPEGSTLSETRWTGSRFTIENLLAGSWTLLVTGRNDSDQIVAQASIVVTIVSGSTVSASVTLSPPTGSGSTGSFSLSLTWSSPLMVTAVGGTISPLGGGTGENYTATIIGDTASYSRTDLPAGSYLLVLEATDSRGEHFRTIDGLRIYKDLESPLVMVLTSDYFTTSAAAPVFSPEGGSYASGQTVSIVTTTPGASIRYTRDGSTPTSTLGRLYDGPFTINSTTTVKAVAYKSTTTNSPVSSAIFTINGSGGITVTDPWNPEITLSGIQAIMGYGGSMTVTAMATPAPDSYAWYLDGIKISGADSASITLGGSMVPGSYLATVVVGKGGILASKHFSFTILDIALVSAPVFSLGSGIYNGTKTVTMTSSTPGASMRFTTDGSTPSESYGIPYTSDLSVTSTQTIRALAYKSGMISSIVSTATYTITGSGSIGVTDPWNPVIIFSGHQPLIGYGEIMIVTAGVYPAPDVYAWYLDGAPIAGAVTESVTLSTAILPGAHLLSLVASKGTAFGSKEFSFKVLSPDEMAQVANPVLTPGTGIYAVSQSVTITSATAGASIRYTTDGTKPTSVYGNLYSYPASTIYISSTQTITAVAYKSAMKTSGISTAAYTINGGGQITVTPPFNPVIMFSGQQATIAYGAKMTVTATVRPEPDSYAWYLDGRSIAGATGSSVMVGGSVLPGAHNLAVIVTKGGDMASKELNFQVLAPGISSLGRPGIQTPMLTETAYAWNGAAVPECRLIMTMGIRETENKGSRSRAFVEEVS
jgi:hypothetical protein